MYSLPAGVFIKTLSRYCRNELSVPCSPSAIATNGHARPVEVVVVDGTDVVTGTLLVVVGRVVVGRVVVGRVVVVAGTLLVVVLAGIVVTGTIVVVVG